MKTIVKTALLSVLLTVGSAAVAAAPAADPVIGTWQINVAKSTFKADGKDYPLTGAANFDSLSLKQVDDHTVQSTQKKGSKVIGTTTRTVSKDGKVLTLASKGTSATGVAYDNVMVYDKQ